VNPTAFAPGTVITSHSHPGAWTPNSISNTDLGSRLTSSRPRDRLIRLKRQSDVYDLLINPNQIQTSARLPQRPTSAMDCQTPERIDKSS
jgi:hypothetical protein